MLHVLKAGVDVVKLILEWIDLSVDLFGEVVEELLEVGDVDVATHGSDVGIEMVSRYQV